jgi:hypothetical protein
VYAFLALIVDHSQRPASGKKSMKHYLKIFLNKKGAVGMVQVIECLPSKFKALGSNSNITNNMDNKLKRDSDL